MSKVMIGNKEIKNPILRALTIIFGVMVALVVIVFVVLPVLGFALGLTASLLILILGALCLALPLVLLIVIPLKLGSFKLNFDYDDKNLLQTNANFGDFDLSNIQKIKIYCRNGNLKVIGKDQSNASASVEGVDNRFHHSIKDKTFNLVFKQKEKINVSIELPQNLDVYFYVGAGNVEYKNLKGFVDSKIGAGNLSGENLKANTNIKLGAGNVNLSYSENNLNTQIDIKLGSGKSFITLPKNSLVKTNFKSAAGKLSTCFPNSDKANYHINVKSGAGNLEVNSREIN